MASAYDSLFLLIKFHLSQSSMHYRRGRTKLFGFPLFEQSVYFGDYSLRLSLKIDCQYFVLGFSIPYKSFFPACSRFCYSSVKEPEIYFKDGDSCCTLQPNEVSLLQLIPPIYHAIPEHPEILFAFSLSGSCTQSRNLL